MLVGGLVGGACQWSRPADVPSDAAVADADLNGAIDAEIDAPLVDARVPIVGTNAAADLVLGQADFVSAADRGCVARSIGASGVGFDGATLWVGDSPRSRALGWSVANLSIDAPAGRVVGHAAVTDCSAPSGGVTGAVLSTSVGTFGANQVLFVVDSGYNRVLGFSPPPTLGGSSNTLIGQSLFSTTGNGWEVPSCLLLAMSGPTATA